MCCRKNIVLCCAWQASGAQGITETQSFACCLGSRAKKQGQSIVFPRNIVHDKPEKGVCTERQRSKMCWIVISSALPQTIMEAPRRPL